MHVTPIYKRSLHLGTKVGSMAKPYGQFKKTSAPESGPGVWLGRADLGFPPTWIP